MYIINEHKIQKKKNKLVNGLNFKHICPIQNW